MKKKILVIMATLLALVFSASLGLAVPNPKGQDTKSASQAVTATQNIQPDPAMGTPPPSSPASPIGTGYYDGQYYPGWGCGSYNAGGYGSPYYCGWGRGYGCCW